MDAYSMTKEEYDRAVEKLGHPPTWQPSNQHRLGQEVRPLDVAPLGRVRKKQGKKDSACD